MVGIFTAREAAGGVDPRVPEHTEVYRQTSALPPTGWWRAEGWSINQV